MKTIEELATEAAAPTRMESTAWQFVNVEVLAALVAEHALMATMDGLYGARPEVTAGHPEPSIDDLLRQHYKADIKMADTDERVLKACVHAHTHTLLMQAAERVRAAFPMPRSDEWQRA